MFAECGIEVYKAIGTVWVEEEGSGQNVMRTNIVVRTRERFEQVQQQLYTAFELIDQLDGEDIVQNQRMEEWANHVQATLGSLMSVCSEDVVGGRRPWEL